MDHFLDKYIFPHTQKYLGRAPKTKDGLPIYSKDEELANTISHIVGIVLGIGALITSIIYHHSEDGLIAGLIFAFSLIILYMASSMYHATPIRNVKDRKILRVIDHCSIFILVAGTCSPFILNMIYVTGDMSEWIFYALIWFMALGGIAMLCINMQKYKSLAVLMYVVMGGLLVTRADILLEVIGEKAFLYLIFGAIFYLIGLLFYGLGSKNKWMHTVFHGFCIIGSIMHSIAVIFFVI